MSVKVVVLDDEKEIADLITLYLENEDYEVHTFYHVKKALHYIENNKIDLALIDIMMPEIDGFSLCKMLREKYVFPIIMVTAKEEELDKITGLTLGADDYITKPFRPLELVARIKAQLRRYKRYNQNDDKETIVHIKGLVLDVDNHICVLNEKELPLTPIEFSILEMLSKNAGKVVSSERLFEEVWKEKYYTNNNTVMVHIRHLREKMGDSAEHPKYIKTVWGVGYKIEK